MGIDVASWLAKHGTYTPQLPGYTWDFASAPDARELAGALMNAASTQTGKPAALALDALRAGVTQAANGGGRWFDAFAVAVLARPAFIGPAALAHNPPLPLGEQHYCDRRSDAYLSRNRTSGPDRVEQVGNTLVGDPARSPADAEQLWLCVGGGSAGIASALVTAVERMNERAAAELRRALVAGVHDALITGAGLPFWPRARLVGHIARENRWLLAELLAHEQEPWLRAQMKYELTNPRA
ncbi:MAG: hypothetical protein SFX73_23200 [Kofleriaceae bacterium]|nr:hypothetical protein [Kofleriaceae bacterium]